MRLANKVAIVTGVASGIGKGTAMLFAAEGAHIIGADINKEDGERTVRAILDKGGKALFVPTDVANGDQVKNLVSQAVSTYGGLDILFSNVGVVIGNAIADVSEEEWDRVMAVNLKSMFLCCKYSIPEMRRQGKGSIVLMSSANGLIAEPALASYCATKAAIIGLTRSIATDYGKYNIRINCVCPSYTRTSLLENWINSGVDTSLTWDKVNSLHVLNRIADVDEIARAILFLASDESSIITGTALVADGGLTCFR
jgi:NAD(P)-dependent dehydrogenase (short-subunit alcohol dehydrogenase family)